STPTRRSTWRPRTRPATGSTATKRTRSPTLSGWAARHRRRAAHPHGPVLGRHRAAARHDAGHRMPPVRGAETVPGTPALIVSGGVNGHHVRMLGVLAGMSRPGAASVPGADVGTGS